MNYDVFKSYSQMAQGLKKSPIVLKNARLVNVFSEEVKKADIAIADDKIIGVGDNYSGESEIEMHGKFVCPGFIDAHLHMESGMVSPAEFVATCLKFGTTTYIVDPHESANVSGKKGIDFILDQTKNVPANVYLMLPSCVPATPFEDNGYNFDVTQMKDYIDNPRILGLGEIMNYIDILTANPELMEKMDLFKNKLFDGHTTNLNNNELSAYFLSGISSDHECCTFSHALEEVRRGVNVLIREGSAARNVESIIKGIVKNFMPIEKFSFCTDDKHIEDIKKEGHISFNIKKAISLGLNPIYAIKMATLNAANAYGLKHLGAIAPGRQADIVVLNDLSSVSIDSVYFKGKLVFNEKTPVKYNIPKCPDKLKNTVNIKPLKKEDLSLKVNNSSSVIEMIDNQIITNHLHETVPSENGYFKPTKQFNKVAVIERHKATGKIGLGIVKNFGILNGAIATTVSHDSHNIVVIGDNDRDILLAISEIKRVNGGYTVISDGKVLDTLPLPIMGLISDMPYDFVEKKLNNMISATHRLGVNKNIDPFITLSFISLPVIPEIRVTTRGLFDVHKNEFISKL